MNIIVTGGCGYIGSHTVLSLLEYGHNVLVLDKGSPRVADELMAMAEEIGFKKNLKIESIDLCVLNSVAASFDTGEWDCVIHFAALKSVEDSVWASLEYYHNNLVSLMNVLKCMEARGCRRIIFSSSATVYGETNLSPMLEEYPTSAVTPYGQTKVMAEKILEDLPRDEWDVTVLRYFNPVGSHPSGRLNENVDSIPANLFPFLLKVLSGEIEELKIFGRDWDTSDGTCVRDFVHIEDLVGAHICCLQAKSGFNVYNVGTGKGTSVLELVEAVEASRGRSIPYSFAGRREGDIGEVYADVSKIERELGWKATRTFKDF
jgi:UDP-glucose 4-epimerase